MLVPKVRNSSDGCCGPYSHRVAAIFGGERYKYGRGCYITYFIEEDSLGMLERQMDNAEGVKLSY